MIRRACRLAGQPAGMASNVADRLHVAAKSGDVPAVRALLEAGADIDAVDTYGNTVLQHVCQNGDVEMARLLLVEFKASVNSKNQFGRTAMHKAAFGLRADVPETLEICLLLSSHGADIEANAARGNNNNNNNNSNSVTPLDIICAESDRYPPDHPQRPPCSDADKDVFREMLRAASQEYHSRLRRDAAWARRGAFFMFLARSGLRPTTAAKKKRDDKEREERRRAGATEELSEPRDWRYLLRQCLGHRDEEAGIVQLVVSFL